MMNTIQHLVRSVNFWKMPKRCVAFGCSNTNKDGVSLFSFPKDPVLSKKCTEQVIWGPGGPLAPPPQ